MAAIQNKSLLYSDLSTPRSDLGDRPPEAVKTYGRIEGAIECFRGNALRVRCAHGPDYFVNKSSLLRMTLSKNDGHGKLLEKDRRVRQAFLRAVAPYGDWQGLEEEEFCAVVMGIRHQCHLREQLYGEGINPRTALTCIEAVDPHRCPELQWEELQEGDIIFTRLLDDAEPTFWEKLIVQGQKLARTWTPHNRPRDSHLFVHVGIYIGEGKIAEAMLDTTGDPELRIVDIDHPYYDKDLHWHCVYRVHDSDLNARAARIARLLTYEAEEDLPDDLRRRYNMTTAVLSVFYAPWKVQLPALLRILNGYHKIESGEGESLSHFKGFHCSYFVPFVFQLAEAERLLPELAARFSAQPPEGSTIDRIQAWAVDWWHTVEKNIEVPLEFQDRMVWKINAKLTCPQELRIFLEERKNMEGVGFPWVESYRLIH
ncbi:MAG: hypothetical protein KDK78_04130 [Chlamydiia bacterium]|nr:hypothetical protein [Chlamydiia bacterium]